MTRVALVSVELDFLINGRLEFMGFTGARLVCFVLGVFRCFEFESSFSSVFIVWNFFDSKLLVLRQNSMISFIDFSRYL